MECVREHIREYDHKVGVKFHLNYQLFMWKCKAAAATNMDSLITVCCVKRLFKFSISRVT